MELNYIEMVNFRQYYGNHKLEFSKGEKNITLIIGENNAGKTGIYRALIYALYGDRALPQDKSASINLVNFQAIDEEGPVKASATISLNHEDENYIIKRELSGNKLGNKYSQSGEENLSLEHFDANGDHTFYDNSQKDEIEKKINEILDSSIKEFFLFDGEKIETLARSDKESKSEVKEGIVKLMQIDRLENLNTHMSRATSVQLDVLKSQAASSELDLLERNKKELEQSIVEKKELVKHKEEDLVNKEASLAKIKEKLKDVKDLSDVYRELDNKKNSLEKQKEISNGIKKGIEKDFGKYSHLLLTDYYRSLDDILANELVERKESIPEDLLRKSLELSRCTLCEQSLDSISFSRIEEILKDYKPSYETDLMSILSRNIKDELKVKDENMMNLEASLKNAEDSIQEVNDIEFEIEEINETISNYNINRENLEFEEKQKRDLEKDIPMLSYEIKSLKEDINDSTNKLDLVDKDIERELRKEKVIDYQHDKYEFMKNLNDNLKNVFSKYEDKTRIQLGKATTHKFKQLIDYKDKSLVDEVRINDKYEIELFEGDMNITADISQGQQMIVALSFITSLASLASNNIDKVDYPLFMDTPFGRLSRENRKNLIENLPKVTKQWIPLLTDTDYTSYESDIFDSNNKVGSIYEIHKIDSRRSEIKRMR